MYFSSLIIFGWKLPFPNLLSKFNLSVVVKAVSDKISSTSCSLNPKIQLDGGGGRGYSSKEE